MEDGTSMNGENVLVVIDMQPFFKSVTKKVVSNVLKLIREFKKQNNFIFVLEYNECGETHPSIVKELNGYDNVQFVVKKKEDGSLPLIKAMKIKNPKRTKMEFNVCGVNTDACVADTVLGLNMRMPLSKINVIKRACNTDSVIIKCGGAYA